MKNIFRVALLFIAATTLYACSEPLPATEEVGPFTVETIEKGVYHIEDCNTARPAGNYINAEGKPTQNNCSDIYLIVGKKSALLIDLSNRQSGEDAVPSLQKIVYDRIGDKQLYITITHSHGDHTGMMPAFYDEERALFWVPASDFERSNIFPEGRTEKFAEGASIDLGGKVVNTLIVPGHTTGSTVFFLEGSDACFTGDAIGSGDGVWIFSYNGFLQYVDGVESLIAYIEDPANGINAEELIFYGGHDWQKGNLEKLDMQYLYDMRTLIEQLANGTADYIPQAYNPMLNANYKYGTAKITWNTDSAKRYAEEMAAK